jgi:integrase
MSVRKRTWTTPAGESRTAWVVDYTPPGQKRTLKTFDKKRDAEAFQAKVKNEIGQGIHSAGKTTVGEAGEKWLQSCEANKLERATLADYKRLVDLHIVPFLGRVKLAALTAPKVREFEDALRKDPSPRSPAMVKRVMVALSSTLADAMDRGLVAQNVAHRRVKRKNGLAEARQKRQLEVGRDIPSPAEVGALVAHLADGRERALILTAIFCGLRASELRGLTWKGVDLDKGELHVRQRADRYAEIGPTKSEAGQRTIPLMQMVVSALRQWKLASPRSSAVDLVFPGRSGKPLTHGAILRFHWHPLQRRAGLVVAGKDGKPQPKYGGLHALRHFYASWLINRRADGGLELPGKVVQGRLGHSNIAMTMDTYGHLFPRADDSDEMAKAQAAFLALVPGN